MGENNWLIVFVVILGAISCFSATTGRRPVQTPPVIPTTNSDQKQNSKDIIHSAFSNAGKKAGLEIWRIEVS